MFVPDSGRIQMIEDIELYKFTNFLADIGGYLGLLLGASVLSISEGVLNSVERWFSKKERSVLQF